MYSVVPMATFLIQCPQCMLVNYELKAMAMAIDMARASAMARAMAMANSDQFSIVLLFILPVLLNSFSWILPWPGPIV